MSLGQHCTKVRRKYKQFEVKERTYQEAAREMAAQIYEFCVEAINNPAELSKLADKKRVKDTRSDASPFVKPIKLILGRKEGTGPNSYWNADYSLVNTYSTVCLYADYCGVKPKDFSAWLRSSYGGGGSLSACRRLASEHQVTPGGKNYKYGVKAIVTSSSTQTKKSATSSTPTSMSNAGSSSSAAPNPKSTSSSSGISAPKPKTIMDEFLSLPIELRTLLSEKTKGVVTMVSVCKGCLIGWKPKGPGGLYNTSGVHVIADLSGYRSVNFMAEQKALVHDNPTLKRLSGRHLEEHERLMRVRRTNASAEFLEPHKFIERMRSQFVLNGVASFSCNAEPFQLSAQFWSFDHDHTGTAVFNVKHKYVHASVKRSWLNPLLRSKALKSGDTQVFYDQSQSRLWFENSVQMPWVHLYDKATFRYAVATATK